MATIDQDHIWRDGASASPVDQYEAVRHVAAAVANGADTESVFRLVAEEAAALVGADGAGVVRFADGQGILVGRWARPGLSEITIRKTIPLEGPSAVAQVHQTGRAARVFDYGGLDDDRARYLSGVYRNGVAVPVRLGAQIWGAVAVGVADDVVLPDGTEDRLADFAELVALAVANPDPRSREGIETLLETILSSAPVGIAFFDMDLRFVRVNGALAEINGRPVADHIGRSLKELDPAFPDEVVDAMASARDTGEPVLDLEVSGETPATPGVLRHWLSSFYPVRSQHGAVVGVGTVVVEVTDAKRGAEELRRERDYSAALIAAMQDGLAVAKPDGTLIDVSVRFCEMTGFPAGELVGRSPPYPYWPDDAELIREAFARALTGITGEHDLVFRRRDGRPLPVVVAHAPLRGPNGELEGLVATVRDVTERRRAEEERSQLLAAERAARDRTELLQRITALLATALTPDQVLEIATGHGFAAVGDPHGTVMLVEDDVLIPARTTDLRTDAVGAPLRIPIDDPSPLALVVRTGRARFFTSRAEIAATHPDALDRERSDTEAAAIVPLAIEGRITGVLGFIFNRPREFSPEDRALFQAIGDLCAQALERAQLYAQARANADALRQRDALKTAVLRGVSHEFRSPLTAIANAADALEHVADPDERGELLGVVGAETRRLDRLVANVLDLSRLEAGVLEPRMDWCAPAELVAGALEAAAALTSGAIVEADISEQLPLIRADPVLTERVLLNLIHNAVRHGAPPVRIEVRTTADAMEIVVSDQGPGVDPSVAGSIFDPFVGSRDRGGVGLGLGLSRGLAEAQGGWLRLEPMSAGTRFVLSLPLEEWREG